jgi:predicted nucleotidyltransferase
LDFLVEFENPEAPGISDRYFALADGLEKIFQRPVDLVTRQSIKNRIFRETVNSTSQPLYAA